jgi:2,5-diketo-D-gluconate reductase A
MSRHEAADVVRTAVTSGYRAVDTAAIYHNEDGVGEGLGEAPEVFLTTKLWNDDQGFDQTLRAFDASLARLKRKAVDLYLIHWPSPARGLYLDSWRALIRLRQEGRARSIGVSNFVAEHLERIMGETGVVPAVNQVELHPSFQQTTLRAFHEAHAIHTESWSPLGQGQSLTDPAIVAIAAKHGKTPAQVVIRWHLQSGLIVIPKSAHPARIRENIAVFDFVLDDDDMGALRALDRPDGRIGPDPATATF